MAEITAQIDDDRIINELKERFHFNLGNRGEIKNVDLDDTQGGSIEVTVNFRLDSETFNHIVWGGKPPQ